MGKQSKLTTKGQTKGLRINSEALFATLKPKYFMAYLHIFSPELNLEITYLEEIACNEENPSWPHTPNAIQIKDMVCKINQKRI